MEKPKYEQLRGLSPTIAIEQKSASSNPRSTVGTVTEIYDYLRVLYARAGEQRCHLCGGAVDGALGGRDRRRAADAARRRRSATLLARKAENRKGEFREVFEEARKAGLRARAHRRPDPAARGRHRARQEEEAHDRARDRPRHASTPASARASPTRSRPRVQGRRRLGAGRGRGRGARARLQRGARLPDCGVGLPELSPQSFSFNSPLGMCVDCNGLGSSLEIDPDLIVPNPRPVDPRRRHRAVGRARRDATRAGPRTSRPRCRASSASRSTSRGRT